MREHVMRHRATWVIFFVALAVRALLILTLPRSAETFNDEPGQVAIALSQGDGFSNPYSAPSGPTAHVAPLVPVLLAFLIKLFGSVDAAWLASRLLACVVIALYAALLPGLAVRLGLGRQAGLLAGAVAAVPFFVWVETNGKFETPYVLLATTLLVASTAYRLAYKGGARRPREWALLGLGWGVGVLLAPTLLPVMLALLLFGVVWRSAGVSLLRPRDAALVVAAAALVFVPYSIERSVRVGGLTLVRSNFGLELFLSNNPDAQVRFLDNIATGRVIQRYHPLALGTEAERVQAMGEGPYNTMMRHRAAEWIAANPGQFARLTLGRIREFWFPTTNSVVKSLLLWGLTGVGVGWLLLHAIRGKDEHATIARACLVAIVAYSLLFYVIQADVRYRYPIQGLLTVAAAAGALELLRRRSRAPAPVRVRFNSPAVTTRPLRPVERTERVPIHADGQSSQDPTGPDAGAQFREPEEPRVR